MKNLSHRTYHRRGRSSFAPTFLFLLIISLLTKACSNTDPEDFVFVDQDSGMTGSMRAISVVSGSSVWLAGSGGEFSTTIDGGLNWFHGVVPGADQLDFRDLHAFSEKEAVLMSAGPGELSRIFSTHDGGKTWKLNHINQEEKGFFDGFDFYGDQGILFSDPIDSRLNLWATQNRGESWEKVSAVGFPLLLPDEYAFAASGTSLQYDPTGGIWLATGGSVARIWHTKGLDKPWKVWETEALQGEAATGLFSIAAHSTLRVVAVGGHYQDTQLTGRNVLLQEHLGEIDWIIPEGASDVPFMECVRWLNSSVLLTCGPPGVWFSSDRGLSWEEINKASYHAFDFDHKDKTGWMVGNQGQVSRFTW